MQARVGNSLCFPCSVFLTCSVDCNALQNGYQKKLGFNFYLFFTLIILTVASRRLGTQSYVYYMNLFVPVSRSFQLFFPLKKNNCMA